MRAEYASLLFPGHITGSCGHGHASTASPLRHGSLVYLQERTRSWKTYACQSSDRSPWTGSQGPHIGLAGYAEGGAVG
jgi:hypothetical protein